MNRTAIEAIVGQYEKHGWVLRRVLLSAAALESIKPGDDHFIENAQLVLSDLDAAWFSRTSPEGRETWELRSLGSTPYAIDAFLDEALTSVERDEILQNTEDRMLEAAPHLRDN
jgi:hypothetical protein